MEGSKNALALLRGRSKDVFLNETDLERAGGGLHSLGGWKSMDNSVGVMCETSEPSVTISIIVILQY